MKKLKKLVLFLVALLILTLGFIFKLKKDLKEAQTNPRIVEVYHEVEVPKIKYRTIKGKAEAQVIEKVVYKYIQEEKRPIPVPTPDYVNESRKQNRYLAGVSIHGLGSDRWGHSFLGGYSFGNRLDVLAGVSPQEDVKYSLQAVSRF